MGCSYQEAENTFFIRNFTVKKHLSLNKQCLCQIVPLSCVCQNYAWGKVGNDSAVAKLAALNKDIDVDQEQAYAEYWFGTHKKGPAKIKSNGEELSSLLGNCHTY